MSRSTLALGAFVCVIAGGLWVSACTSLTARHVKESDETRQPTGSIGYILPRKAVTVSVTYVLKNCTTFLENGKPALRLELDTTATATASNEADPSQRYYIPYDTLRSWMKETQVTLEYYPNKTLKTLNVTINDQGAAIFTSTIGTLIKLNALVAAGAAVSTQDEMCSSEAIESLQIAQTDKDKLAAISTAANGPPKPALEQKVQKKDGGAQDPTATSQIAKIQASLDRTIADHLTSRVATTWIPQIKELVEWVPGRDAAILQVAPDIGVARWLSPKGQTWLAAAGKERDAISIFVVAAIPTWDHAKTEPTVEDTTSGLVVRDPAVGILYVCKGPCPKRNSGSVVTVDNAQAESSMAFPQLGKILVIPLHNSAMQNSVLDIAVSEDGVVTRLGLHHSGSVSSAVKDLGGDIDAAKTAEDARNKAKADAGAAAKTKARDANKTLADCLDAQKAIVKDGGAPIGSCQ